MSKFQLRFLWSWTESAAENRNRLKIMNNLTIVLNFFSAFIISAGTAFGCVLIGSSPTKWQIVGCIVAGLVVAAKDTRSLLKLPPVENTDTPASPPPKPPLPLIFLIGALSLGVLSGCAGLQPGSDPIVVNAERLETTAAGAFKFVKEVDNANREFYKTNAPAFHQFVEYLRTPIRMDGTNIIRRDVDMILAVNSAKQTYIQNIGQSNLLKAAVNVLQASVIQAQSWQSIIQTPTP
jgi:hypothetical protein